jgi:pimeloyl-ACP methyl ester carboxylesterase
MHPQRGTTAVDMIDDNLETFAAHGAALPPGGETGSVVRDWARIWYAVYGAGPAVILLHGGMGHGGNWAYQIPAIVASGRRAIVIDSRGHGHSTRDARPFSYALMAADVVGVMDRLGLESSPIVGWSDGACIGLVLARRVPARVTGLLFFACNVDPTGTKPFVMTPVIER